MESWRAVEFRGVTRSRISFRSCHGEAAYLLFTLPFSGRLAEKRGEDPVTKDDFIKLMEFPREWREWGLLPDELLNRQLAQYRSGGAHASAHFRAQAFHFWLQRRPSKDVLLKLARLSFLDPDPLVAYSLRKDHIAKADNVDDEVRRALRQHRM